MTYRCPVCGFEKMPFPPEDNNICSCCGTEFGYHDLRFSHADLRRQWLAKGSPWFSTRMSPPFGWNPTAQINQILMKGAEASSSATLFSTLQPRTTFYSFRS